MIVQDPLSGYLHEVPDALAYYDGYGDYGGGYYGGYDEYVDPAMAEYPGELGNLGFFFLPRIIRAITGGGGRSSPPPPPPSPPAPIPVQATGAAFAPFPGMRAYIASVVRDVLSQTQPGAGQMFAQGGGGMGFRRRRRRR